MLKIRQLIKRVRACRTAEEERSVINKESAEIRNASKNLNNPHKARDLCKAIYMSMMGYQTSFMQLSCINLLASSNFTEKRMAYSALSLIMDSTSQVLLLATASIKKDLENEHENPEAACLALNAIGDICTPDMCRELSTQVASMIRNGAAPNILKKAACAATYIIKKCPELIDSFEDKIDIFLDNRTHSVCLTGINFALEILKKNPNFSKKLKKYHNMFVKYEKTLLSVSYSPEFDVNGITDPFLQAKLLEIMKFTAQGNKNLSDELGDLFVSVQSITEASKQTGYALQYEIVKTINNLESNAGMKALSNNILGKFLSGKDLNLKYIALNTLKDVARYDLISVQKHKNLILEFLKDKDISLQKRALDLLYLIINKNNLKSIVKECIKFLPSAQDEIKFELTRNLTESIDKFSSSFKYEIDSYLKMIIVCDSKIYDESLSKIINVIMNVKELFVYSAHKLFVCLKNNKENCALSKIAFYIFGEIGEILVKNSVLNRNNEKIFVSVDELIFLMDEIGDFNHKKGKNDVIEYLLNAYVKLSIKFSEKKDEIKGKIQKFLKSYYYEVQQRASEYFVFETNENEELKNKIVKNVPVPKDKNSKNEREFVENEDDDENDENVVKLSEKIVKINDDDDNNNENPFENININKPNENNNNNNNNENNNQNTLNLLDLNNIFNANSSNNNNNNENNNNNNNQNDILNLLSGINTNNNNNNNNINNNNNNNENPFLDFTNNNNNNSNENKNIIPEINNNNNNNNESLLKECFRNEDLSMYYKYSLTSENNYNGIVYLSNNSNNVIDKIKINFMVKKHIKLNPQPTSNNVLKPNESLGISKELSLFNNDPNKNVEIRIKLIYSKDNKENTHLINIEFK